MFPLLFFTLPVLWIFLFNSFLFAVFEAKVRMITKHVIEQISAPLQALLVEISRRVTLAGQAVWDFLRESVSHTTYKSSIWTLNIHVLSAVIILGLSLHSGLLRAADVFPRGTHEETQLAVPGQLTDSRDMPELREFGATLIVPVALLAFARATGGQRAAMTGIVVLGIALSATGHLTPADLGVSVLSGDRQLSTMPMLGITLNMVLLGTVSYALGFNPFTPFTVIFSRPGRLILAFCLLSLLVVYTYFLQPPVLSNGLDLWVMGMATFAFWSSGVMAGMCGPNWDLLGTCALFLGLCLMARPFRLILVVGMRQWWIDDLLNRPWIWLLRVGSWMTSILFKKSLSWVLRWLFPGDPDKVEYWTGVALDWNGKSSEAFAKTRRIAMVLLG